MLRTGGTTSVKTHNRSGKTSEWRSHVNPDRPQDLL